MIIPVSVARRLESIQCYFLWGDEEGRRRFHLVRWEDVKRLMNMEGLGIQSFIEMNTASQGKWLWRCRFLEKKYLLFYFLISFVI